MLRAQDVEKDYDAAMKRSTATTTPKVAIDPWRNVRPAGGTGDKK